QFNQRYLAGAIRPVGGDLGRDLRSATKSRPQQCRAPDLVCLSDLRRAEQLDRVAVAVDEVGERGDGVALGHSTVAAQHRVPGREWMIRIDGSQHVRHGCEVEERSPLLSWRGEKW